MNKKAFLCTYLQSQCHSMAVNSPATLHIVILYIYIPCVDQIPNLLIWFFQKQNPYFLKCCVSSFLYSMKQIVTPFASLKKHKSIIKQFQVTRVVYCKLKKFLPTSGLWKSLLTHNNSTQNRHSSCVFILTRVRCCGANQVHDTLFLVQERGETFGCFKLQQNY